MIQIRKAADRGHFNFGWLDTYHTFSFGEYYDAEQMGYHSLRVINEDRVGPGRGFGTHPHRDMEIVTYVLDGELKHEDSLGTGSVIRPGEIQRMSAGTGVTHSEFNASADRDVHLLQIWILPKTKGLTPSYEQKKIDLDSARGKWNLIASENGGETAAKLNQDANLSVAILSAGERLSVELANGRHAWLQVARGSVRLNDMPLVAGDGAAVADELRFSIEATTDAELLLFDLS